MQAGLIAARFVHDIALLLLFGGALFPIYAMRGEPELDRSLVRRSRTALGWMCAAGLASGAVWLVLTAAGMSGGHSEGLNPATLAFVVGQTEFGQLWAVRLVLLALLTWLVLTGSGGRARGWMQALLAGAVLASLAGTGHARSEEGVAGWVHVGADAVHLAASGFWIGGLPPLTLLLSGDPDLSLARRVLKRFSALAVWIVAGLVVSGAINAWLLVGAPGAMITTVYGRLLLLKLALVIGMVSLAALNRYRLTPALAQDGTTAALAIRRLRTHIGWEQGLACAVVGLVGALGVLAPPAT